jgi:hypothetical protein
MASLDSIWRLLEEAAARLNEAALQVRDLPLEPKREHMHRIGQALSEIHEIQYHVFALQPDLTPQIFRGPFEHPEGALNVALAHAGVAEENGNIDVAIALLRWVVPRISDEYAQSAKAEIARLEGKRDA